MQIKTHISSQIKIQHSEFGLLLNETFTDKTQFKLFLQMTQSCLELGNDLTFFNGEDFLLHIPHQHLKNSIITTNVDSMDMTDHLRSKVIGLQNK